MSKYLLELIKEDFEDEDVEDEDVEDEDEIEYFQELHDKITEFL
jgi:hypothetical protein